MYTYKFSDLLSITNDFAIKRGPVDVFCVPKCSHISFCRIVLYVIFTLLYLCRESTLNSY